jgi:hypothetical protein
MDGSMHTIRKNTETLVIAAKDIRLEANAEKTKYMIISPDQNARQNSNMKVSNKLVETVKEFRYLRKTLTIQNSIREEIKSRLKSGNACYN